jgi:large subunit ribosomal protein L3
MKKGIIGRKIGMTQLFLSDGTAIGVTVIEAGPCSVLRKKTVESDGYEAVCVGFGEIREKLVNKPKAGEFKKAGLELNRYTRELKLDNTSEFEVGQQIKADMFSVGDIVDVSGLTKGHGFSGTVKRWNTRIGPEAHGSKYHRGPGSMGANTSPGRVFKNKRLPGHYGVENVTIQCLEVVKVDAERNFLMIKGAVPGVKGALLVVRDSVKK